MTDQDADLDAILAQLEAADLVEQYVNDDGKLAMRLTSKGAQLGRSMALAGDAAANVPDALPDGERPAMGR